jgi:hypothetical protein
MAEVDPILTLMKARTLEQQIALALCALVAALIPGTRGASIPPMHALRLE